MNSQKLKLRLEELSIQSFATTHANARPGTIIGYSITDIVDTETDTETETGAPPPPQQPSQACPSQACPSKACPPLQITPVIQCNG